MIYAQTNLQLFNQMRVRRYAEADVAALHSAYGLAVRLFTAEFRGSGKPLLAHAVGTASVLCALEAPTPLLAAAILHAAYIFGEFGDGRRGATASKRQVVRETVGPEVEALISSYHSLVWNWETVPAVAARVADMSEHDKQVLLIRLANELEDHLDLGVLYCGNAGQRRHEIRSSLYLCVDMSRALGYPVLATELERAFNAVLSTDVPDVLRGDRDHTYMLPPLSHRPAVAVALRHLLDTHPRVGRVLQPGRFLNAVLPRRVRPARAT